MRRVLVFALALFAAATAHGDTLIASLSSDRVSITSNFNGTELAVFGAIRPEAGQAAEGRRRDIVITVRGPRGAVTVFEKEHAGPFWLNLAQRRFVAVPAFLAVLTNRPLAEIASAPIREREHLGVDTQVPARSDGATDVGETAFRTALARLRTRQGLFTENATAVRFLAPDLFQASVRLPGAAPLGSYDVDVALVDNGEFIARQSLRFSVLKTGFEDGIAATARDQGLVYGLAACLMAIVMGWLASVIFRRD